MYVHTSNHHPTTKNGDVTECCNCRVITLLPGLMGQTCRLQVQTLSKLTSATLVATYRMHSGGCEKDVSVRIGKATAVFGKMRKIWKNKCINLRVNMRL